ncbi:MAG: aspartate carbamoyltransferase [Clostridiales Family XIII bacterium]|jgi:aspartate carbamoyltransferase catalytic subunit|nr:aspartate carbamoyltransferase [Clostridiales Family XIII bacterium]
MQRTLQGRNLIEPLDFSVDELEGLFDLSMRVMKDPGSFAKKCAGRLLATLFYEPSTRTRFSFEAAMLRLGGQVIGFSGEQSSSAAKGESIADTVRTVACYADIAVIRHPKEGAPRVAAQNADIPVINGGDGGHQHPTQTLTDLLTVRKEKKRLAGLRVGLCGDLKFGRTVHSLIKALARYEGMEFFLISPEELVVPEYVRNDIRNGNDSRYTEVTRMQDVLPQLDILYMTRVQKERFFNEEDYVRLKDSYILDADKMKLAPADMIVMHPLPRVNEISTEVDADPRAVYFKQAKNGMYVRMALILSLLGAENGSGENTVPILSREEVKSWK